MFFKTIGYRNLNYNLLNKIKFFDLGTLQPLAPLFTSKELLVLLPWSKFQCPSKTNIVQPLDKAFKTDIGRLNLDLFPVMKTDHTTRRCVNVQGIQLKKRKRNVCG